jgi:hypothetical protein
MQLFNAVYFDHIRHLKFSGGNHEPSDALLDSAARPTA